MHMFLHPTTICYLTAEAGIRAGDPIGETEIGAAYKIKSYDDWMNLIGYALPDPTMDIYDTFPEGRPIRVRVIEPKRILLHIQGTLYYVKPDIGYWVDYFATGNIPVFFFGVVNLVDILEGKVKPSGGTTLKSQNPEEGTSS